LPYEEDGKKYVKYEVIGENNVAVPTDFFKLVKIHSDINECNVYIVPNAEILTETSLGVFEAQIDQLERVSGLKLKNVRN
jgi:endonuclease G, mitochondrial